MLWEVSSGYCLRTFQGHAFTACAVALSRDGRLVLSSGIEGKLKLWEVSSGRCLRTFEGHTGSVKAVAACIHIFKGHTSFVKAVALSGGLALSGSADNTVKLWEVSTGRCLRSFEGHTDSMSAVALSGDGRLALSGGGDKTVKLWEVSSGRCLRSFEGHTDSVSTVALRGDGGFALSGSADGTIALWFLDWELADNQSADWHEGARPFLENFLTNHTSFVEALQQDREPTVEEITRALTHQGQPVWTEEQFQQLLHTLGYVGFGWLRSEGVRRELQKMAATWQGPPPLVP